MLKFGFVFPGGEARTAAEFAREAEQAGWDGFFVWEPVWGVDAWVSLTAAAMLTSKIRLGTMLTPLSRMRPWKLASETATLDRLSNGRVILAVGLGAVDTGFYDFGEVTDRKTRAELLDEGLAILTGLWRGQPFSYTGKHYQVSEFKFHKPKPPIQQPRIPIWVVGLWGSKRSMGRALSYDGLLPAIKNEAGEWPPVTPEQVHQIRSYVNEIRGTTSPYDIVVEGETPGDDPLKAASIVRPFAEAGATWWNEAMWSEVDGMLNGTSTEKVLARIRQGPPRIKPA